MAADQNYEAHDDATSFRAHLRRLIDGGKASLPVLPDSATELLCMCADENVESDDVQDHGSRVQARCAHVRIFAKRRLCSS